MPVSTKTTNTITTSKVHIMDDCWLEMNEVATINIATNSSQQYTRRKMEHVPLVQPSVDSSDTDLKEKAGMCV